MATKGNNSDNNRQTEIGMLDFFNPLPEGCIANVLCFTSPRDVCRLSLVASTFRSAADSDTVWDRFIPSDYQDIVARRSVDREGESSSRQAQFVFERKKELYLHLCDHPIVIDGGTKSFSVDKMSGKKCYMLAARELTIVWGDTPMYWIFKPLPESRFSEVAELLQVCWLEIRGTISIRLLSPNTLYVAYLVFKFGDAFGFEDSSVEAWVGISGDEISGIRTVYLNPEERRRRAVGYGRKGRRRQKVRRSRGGMRRADGWLEVELGEFANNGDHDDRDLEMYVMEVKRGTRKGGLFIEGIEIRPAKCCS